ncbi:RNA-binding protein Pin4p [Monosporozyma servazzii]
MSEQMDDTNLIPNENNINYSGSNDNSDDVIPNAIVIKNIPFAIKKEQLLDIIDEMGLPLPYAFNYHFDNGIFRGLAFANFTTTEETVQVINDLNGKDINGRKLKVEYKKLLPQHERDRIEREKREKRGQLEEQHRQMSNLSLQSLNRVASNSSTTNNNTPAPTTTTNNNNNNSTSTTPQLFNQYISSQNNFNSGYNNNFSSTSLNQTAFNNNNNSTQQPLLVAQHTANSTYSNSNFNAGSVYSSSNNNNNYNNNNINNNNSNNNGERYYAPLPSSSNVSIPPQQLDFNDPDTLEIYSQLLLFKDRELKFIELAYPMGLSANHKRIINVLCSFLNLMEVYDSRFVIIRRKNTQQQQLSSTNVLDQTNLQNHLQQVQNNYSNSNINILQPTSTGGSLNRSTSYTSLLQAHASTMSQSLNNNNNSSTQNTPKLSQSNVISNNSLLQNPQSSNGSPNNFLNSLYNNSANNGSSEQIQHPQPVVSQQLQSPQQQQQSFIRQQATLTPSSRVPSGYSNHHQKMNISNPLLRNSGISPTGGNISTNSTTTNPSTNPSNSNKLSSNLYNNNSSSSNLLNSNINNNNNNNNNNDQINPLVAQHTNGSIHSNLSIQSYHDDGNANTYSSQNQQQQNNGQTAMMNTNDLIYKTLSQSGAVDNADLDNHLARSLSGLDIQDTTSTTKKNTIW